MRSAGREIASRQESPAISRPISPQDTISSRQSSSHDRSHSVSSTNGHGYSPSLAAQEPDLDDQLTTIIQHISSETTGAMHKEGITELHHFLKAHPHKKPKVDKMLESTGPAFRKYITRALASRAAEDEERNVAVANTLSSANTFPLAEIASDVASPELESNSRERLVSQSSTTSSEFVAMFGAAVADRSARRRGSEGHKSHLPHVATAIQYIRPPSSATGKAI